MTDDAWDQLAQVTEAAETNDETKHGKDWNAVAIDLAKDNDRLRAENAKAKQIMRDMLMDKELSWNEAEEFLAKTAKEGK